MTDPFTRLGTVRLGAGVLNRFERDHLLVGDGTSIRRDRLTHPGAVVVVAHEEDAVWFLRQWRPVVGEWTWELPAGLLEPGELPVETAARECEEEIGRRPGALTALGTVLTSPGILAERCHVFEADLLQHVPPRPDEHEEALAERRLIPMRDVPGHVTSGLVANALSLAALGLAGLLRADG